MSDPNDVAARRAAMRIVGGTAQSPGLKRATVFANTAVLGMQTARHFVSFPEKPRGEEIQSSLSFVFKCGMGEHLAGGGARLIHFCDARGDWWILEFTGTCLAPIALCRALCVIHYRAVMEPIEDGWFPKGDVGMIEQEFTFSP